MEKINLTLGGLLTLVGPAQIIEITDEDGMELYHGAAVKTRDVDGLKSREVKHIQALEGQELKKPFLKIWVY